MRYDKIVNISLLILFFSLLPVTGIGFSQSISMEVDNMEIRQVIKTIERQTDYRFFYTDGLADLSRKVSMRFTGHGIEDVLSELLAGTQLGYSIVNEKLVILAPIAVMQQGIVVTGTVSDNDGPLPGVSVSIKGTTQGVVTDGNGNFSIIVPNAETVLQFNFMGFREQEVIVGSQTTLEIFMLESIAEIGEVVVIGYGQQNRLTVTGAVSSMSTTDLLRNPTPNVGNMLVGQVSGVSAIQTTGRPGADTPELYVRGIGTLNAANALPLMLVDGVERDFFQLDPNEIESISVLKDASATAVFGVQGANGVIIVTTRRGHEGAPKISVSMSAGMQIPVRVLQLCNSYEFGMAYNELMETNAFSDYELEMFRTGSDPLLFPSFDWREQLIRKVAFQTNNNINISGGTKFVKYFVSLGYMSQDGIFKQVHRDFHENFTYNRYNYRANFDIDATKTTKLKISLGGVSGIRQEPNVTADGGDGPNAVFRLIYWGMPFSTPGFVDGKMIRSNDKFFSNANIGGGGLANTPYQSWFGRGTQYCNTNDISLDLAVNQDLDVILSGLSANVKYSYNSSYLHNKVHTYSGVPFYTPWRIGDTLDWQEIDPTADPDEIIFIKSGEDGVWGYSEELPNNDKERKYYVEASLNYANNFGQHNVSVLGLANIKKTFYLSNRYNFREIPLGSMGIVGRATYNYAQRYLFEFNVGYNGSENFAEGKRFGIFPAASVGWVLSEEKFMKNNLNFISFLKLRASLGKVGSDFVGQNRFLYLPDTWNTNQTGNAISYLFGRDDATVREPSATENKLGNPDVTWETSVKQNYGIDVTFFDSRLSLNADVFFEKRRDILTARRNVPTYVGSALVGTMANIGKVDNHGYELKLTWRDKIAKGKGAYSIEPSVDFNRNKIVYMDEVLYDYSWRQRTGYRVEQQFGLISERLYRSDDFPEAYQYGSFLAPGDLKYSDLNDDGVIDASDERSIGYSRYPEYVFALHCSFSYKGFDFSMLWQGVSNVSKPFSRLYKEPFTTGENRNLMYFVYQNRFVSEELTPNATYPRLARSGRSWNYLNPVTSSFFIEDASYVRLKNVEIGYTINAAALKKVGVNRMRVYLNGNNLLTFDKLGILDPEERAGLQTRGEYPVMAVVNLGLNFNF